MVPINQIHYSCWLISTLSQIFPILFAACIFWSFKTIFISLCTVHIYLTYCSSPPVTLSNYLVIPYNTYLIRYLNSNSYCHKIGWLQTGFRLVIGFIGLFDTAHGYTLQFTATHVLVSTVTSSLPLLGRGFQQWTFRFLWIPKLSLASATSFWQQQLTVTEPQKFSNWIQLLTGPSYNISTRTTYKTSLPLLLCSLIAMETCLFAEPLVSNGCCIVVCFMVVAKQWVYMPQYIIFCVIQVKIHISWSVYM
jgi:hypothetical protein